MIFFTRLPIGKQVSLEPKLFDRIIDFWPLTGFLSGGLTALCYLGLCFIFPPTVSMIIAYIFRLLFTGGLHEDGLADFCDGFGNSGDKEKTLRIMKDSFIGTYGVLGLIVYSLLFVFTIPFFPVVIGALMILSSDVWCKFCTSKLVDCLPYARTREGSKGHIVYEKTHLINSIIIGAISFAPAIFLGFPTVMSILVAPIVVTLLGLMMSRRIGGYTGDCCGATFLISQCAMILTALALQP